ncbi:MAG: acyl-CoA thioesterase [Acidobacteria bacterium]|nr:MAG: acyl-CoA thioesterase [Acidobacteriota bacterium]
MFVYARRVQFYETDAQGIVHHSNYFRYFEEARGELLRSLGLPYSELRKEGIEVVLLHADCEFIKPLYYDEEFEVRLYLSHMDRFFFSFGYEIYSGTILKAKGKTKHAVLSKGKLVSLPSAIVRAITEFFLGPCKR